MPTRQTLIAEHIRRDPYAAFLGASVEVIEPGYSRVTLTVDERMVNFHGVAHGGLLFSLADVAFAAASNSRGQTAVALQVSVSFMRAARAGDHLVAECREQDLNGPIGLYEIVVRRPSTDELVMQCQATVYRKRDWFVPPE
ncbi:MAG: hotdog fold thioesterase [Chloroflexi bacterium]|nr:hotdog fold thioesterase [Chloroflexota bacterium]